MSQSGHGTGGQRSLLLFVRYGLPAVVVLAGVIVMCMGSESDLEGGAGIVSAGLAVYLINWLFRLAVKGDSERSAEQSARDFFDENGYWPDQAPDDAPRREERSATRPRSPGRTRSEH